MRGPLRKMIAEHADPVRYQLRIGDEQRPLNGLLGHRVRLRFTGEIRCLACGALTRRSFGQGHCWTCFRRLASCDGCIVKPELCHHAAGTCREPEWGLAHCLVPHVVYLANSSGPKVGITRGSGTLGRWMDQGAVRGVAVRDVQTRLDSGRVEVAVRRFLADRTNWRVMLRGDPEPVDLLARWREIEQQLAGAGAEALPGSAVADPRPVAIRYPVLEWPAKIRSLDLARDPVAEGTLLGVKGQWWILDTGHLQIRKHAGFVVELSTDGAA